MRLFLPALFTALLLGSRLYAGNYYFTNYTTEQGLSDNSVSAIAMDGDGYLWIGTEAGLNRFNGYDFTVFKSLSTDTTQLPANSIQSLLASSDGTLWIGTAQGICRYDKMRNCFHRVGTMKNGALVFGEESFVFLEDSKKNVWAGTGLGLLRYDAAHGCFQRMLENSPVGGSGMVNGMAEDKDGTLWLLNYTSVDHYDPATGRVREFSNHFGKDEKFQGIKICNDPGSRDYLWISTWGNGIVRFDKHNGECMPFRFFEGGSTNLDNVVVNAIRIDKERLWLASERGALAFNTLQNRYEGVISDSIHAIGVANSRVKYFYRDIEGILWIATDKGLCSIHPAKQHFVKNKLWDNVPVSEYFIDREAGKIYGVRIYHDRALYIHDYIRNATAVFPIPGADKTRAEPFAIARDRNGLIWIGTTRGVYTFDEKRKKFSLVNLLRYAGIPDRSVFVRQILVDSTGMLWFSCYSKGLFSLDPNSMKTQLFFHNDSDASSWPFFAITGIACGSGNTIVASDEKKGIVRLDTKTGSWHVFSTKEPEYASLYDATDVAVDPAGRTWVTTRSSGLVCVEAGGRTKTYARDEFGNILDEQSNLVIDNDSRVWFSSSYAIHCLQPQTGRMKGYSLQEGLPYRTVPLHRMDDGSITYNSFGSIYFFDPVAVPGFGKPLKMHLVSVSVNGKAASFEGIDFLDTLVLTHTENNLGFEFAATDFRSPATTLYSYCLKGIHDGWSPPSLARTVNFSQLPPGNYEFSLRAGEHSPVKSLFISIIPAWWQTRWFRWLAVFAAAAIAIFLIQLFYSFRFRQQVARLEKQREIEAIRSRISRDIHDEIGSGLTKIKLMSRSLARTEGELHLREATGRISSASDELIQNLGQIVWTINPDNDSFANVVAYIRSYLSKYFEENSGISLALDLPEHDAIPSGVIFDPEKKHNLLLILKECITNIVKHARASEVRVSLSLSGEILEMKITDNGIGLNGASQNGFGNGLKNMRRRAESMHATFTVSSLDNGTSACLRLPLG